MKKILLFLTFILSANVFGQSGSISNFRFSSNPIEIGQTLSFSLDYVSSVNATFSIALLKSQNYGSQIDWSSGMHWQNVNVTATNVPTNYSGTIHLSGFYESSADIAPEVYLVMVQLVDANTGNSMAAVSNWGVSAENTITILPSPDNFNYNYLGSYDTNGTPLYLEPVGDIITALDLEIIDNSLPEYYPVPEYNPHYIAAGYDTDLLIEQDTDVWVTYVSEGAGYTNVLGFYTYDINNPPTTKPSQDEITIIFPNASGEGSGGGLKPGDKVNIGHFSAGTGIGWVLLANAWNGEEVAHDIWNVYSNPDFNPESEADLRNHSVLLTDHINKRLILGFEDVRRDLDWCDNDFNDAVFYITVNPYEALNASNLPEVTVTSTVTSANNGGLESNGNLAGLVAKRNFKRKTSGAVADKKSFQKTYSKNNYKKGGPTTSLANYLPETGMYGTETAYVSSPEDLLGITNAKEVFSIDIYLEDKRVSAALATKTEGSIYDHSKAICDRLNNSSLEDIRTVNVKGHNVISSKIKRATGEIEFTLSFSIKLGGASNQLYSFWNIAQYPEGDYNNYQIWGSSFSQVFAIANHVIDTYTAEKTLKSEMVEDKIPSVFVKSGYYLNGQIHLNIVNKTGIGSMTFNGSIATTEVSNRIETQQNIVLSGDYNETVSITTGTLFDIGFSLATTSSAQIDALYLADGPWGIDYLEDYATINIFHVDDESIDYQDDIHEVERQPTVSGNVKGNVNLFRHILPGDLTLDVSDYNSIQFTMFSNQAVELILMPEELTDWNNRLRYTIPANSNETAYAIEFSEFVNASGNPESLSNIKTVVFSIIGDYSSYKPFEIVVSDLAFAKQSALSVEDEIASEKTSLTNYPNPFKTNTTIKLANASQYIDIMVYDMLGRTVDAQHIITTGKKANYNAPNLSKGIYKYKLVNDLKQVNTGTFMIE